MTKYYKTIVTVEVLSEDGPWNGDLEDLAFDVTQGECSGLTTSESHELSEAEMIAECDRHGTDPEFFMIGVDD